MISGGYIFLTIFFKKNLGEDGQVKNDVLAFEIGAHLSETQRSVTAPKLHYYLREYKEFIIYRKILFTWKIVFALERHSAP
jgi:hypothetical protein